MEISRKYEKKVIKFKYKNLKCPSCKKAPIEPFIPFCSKKCSDLDLMKWLSDHSYPISN